MHVASLVSDGADADAVVVDEGVSVSGGHDPWSDSKLANVVYHDWESTTYDDKWSISFDDRCVSYAQDVLHKIAPGISTPVEVAMEFGSGTGFFLLNLMQSGLAKRGIVTDISSGMVRAAVDHGHQLGLNVDGVACDAEGLPLADASVDLVIGHAVLHHIPDIDAALREILRVLRPGGSFVIAGEPTTWGDRIARNLSRATWWATTQAMRIPGFPAAYVRDPESLAHMSEEAALESVVDLHTFDPDRLAAAAMRAGAVDVRTRTTEFSAAWFGWPVRTFEAAMPPGVLGFGWANLAYRTWQRLYALDHSIVEKFVPQRFFYNVSITGVRPALPAAS